MWTDFPLGNFIGIDAHDQSRQSLKTKDRNGKQTIKGRKRDPLFFNIRWLITLQAPLWSCRLR
jgi:hypothetical protein